MIETEIISTYNYIWSCKLQLKSTFFSFELLLSNILILWLFLFVEMKYKYLLQKIVLRAKRRTSLKVLFLELNNNVNKQKLQQIPLREKYVIDNIKI